MASDPTDADRFVIGVNAVYAAADPNCLGMGLEWSALLVTTTNGTDFSLECTPAIKGTGGTTRVDPTYIFSSNGEVHGSVLDISAALGTRCVQYLRLNFSLNEWTTKHNLTADCGGGKNDRPFITLGPDETVVVTHDNRSSDHQTLGVAWRTPTAWNWEGTSPGCYSPRSPAAFGGGDVYLGCLLTNSTTGVARFNLTTELWAVEYAFGNNTGKPMIDVLPDGRFALAYDAKHYRIGTRDSSTGSISWSQAMLVDVDTSAFASTQLYAFKADPWGGLHFVITQSNQALALHAAVDGATGQVLATHTIREGGSCSSLTSNGDHYGDIDFRDGLLKYGIVAWARDGCIEYAMVEPRW